MQSMLCLLEMQCQAWRACSSGQAALALRGGTRGLSAAAGLRVLHRQPICVLFALGWQTRRGQPRRRWQSAARRRPACVGSRMLKVVHARASRLRGLHTSVLRAPCTPRRATARGRRPLRRRRSGRCWPRVALRLAACACARRPMWTRPSARRAHTARPPLRRRGPP